MNVDRDYVLASVAALGCWRMTGNVADARACLDTAMDAGIHLVDTADIYGLDEGGFGSVEALMGRVFRASPGLRERMLLATKGGIRLGAPYDSSEEYLNAALESSLSRLGVDHVDLYQIHRPDLMTSARDLASTLDRMVGSGRVRHVGLSNVRADQVRAVATHLRHCVFSVQNEFSVFCQQPLEDGVLSWCQETDTPFLAWSPLAGGRLLAASSALPPRERRVQEVVNQIAHGHGVSAADIAFAFVRQSPGIVIPIIGSQSPTRIAALSSSCGPVLSRREWYNIVEAYRGGPMP